MQQIFSRNGRDCTEINSLVVAGLQDWSSNKVPNVVRLTWEEPAMPQVALC